MLQGRTVDFKNTLIIMTSNVGSSVIEKGGGGLGFQLDTSEEDSSYNRIKTLVNEELKQYFRPEFLNRYLISSLYWFLLCCTHFRPLKWLRNWTTLSWPSSAGPCKYFADAFWVGGMVTLVWHTYAVLLLFVSTTDVSIPSIGISFCYVWLLIAFFAWQAG